MRQNNIIVYYHHLRHIKISKNPKSHVALVEGGTLYSFLKGGGLEDLVQTSDLTSRASLTVRITFS